MSKPFALITGASKGIGRAIAERCASYGMNVVLVALPGEGLGNTAAAIAGRYGVQATYFEMDLSLDDSPQRLRDWCERNQLEINVLINNAGIGYEGNFEDFDARFYHKLLHTNVFAPALITREFLPMLLRQKEAWVLFSSSFAGFFPVPFKAMYAASKSFLTQFSRGLHQELRACNIHVSVLCPAGVDSFPESSARIDQLGWIAKSGRLSPHQVARAAVDGMLKGRRRIIPGRINVFLYYLLRLLPTSFVVQVMHSALCRFYTRANGGFGLVTKNAPAKSPGNLNKE